MEIDFADASRQICKICTLAGHRHLFYRWVDSKAQVPATSSMFDHKVRFLLPFSRV
ncbi:hypothetical protein MHOL44478_25815 [Mycobacterium holsaticum DSM 44478]|nr:hypothetical protein [Mycolicibacterium holsaticum DSM 44478 = JCM 12374]